MFVLDLGKSWKLRYEELYADRDAYARVTEELDGWLAVPSLPCDVHVPLIENGIIDDPVVADHCFECEWIEDKSWWFKKVFDSDSKLIKSQNSELVIEGLDAEADLFLNGSYLGRHRSQTYPFRKDVRDMLKTGENELVIRMTSGLEYVNEQQLSQIHWKGKDYASNRFTRNYGDRRDDRRVFVRKPQYVYGWDWNPRIATCGIMGRARIECYDNLAIRSAKFTTLSLCEDSARICIEAEIENLNPITTIDATVDFDILFEDTSVSSENQDVFMTSGLNYIRFECTIDRPRLWWPNGMGPQNLYTVRVRAAASDGGSDFHEFKAGIRTVRLDTNRIGDTSRMFAFVINGVHVFCKGGNWETPDSLYGRIPDEKYDTLVREAKEANFNMFRFNGVNAYERDSFYECCDRYGILVWQDFTFSCAAYPDHLDWFVREAEQEVNYQIKRLRNHPCIALWCGNNECQVSLENYGKYSYLDEKKPTFPRGIVLYNQIMPRLIRELCSEIPYWNSSPFGGVALNCVEYGDRHPWSECLHADMARRITMKQYGTIQGRFVSEFGCSGPPRKSSLVQYHGDKDIAIDSDIWKLHTNEFELGTIRAAITKHYKDSDTLLLDEYLLYGGMFQGMTLGYTFESLRYAQHNYGALIWSYNDSWGEIGWSIIDYYVRRKISYYFVKRALEDQKLIMREDDGESINIICMNDTLETLEFELETGYVSFGGNKENVKTAVIRVNPAVKATVVAQMEKGPHNPSKGVFYASPINSGMIPAILQPPDFRSLDIPRPNLTITGLRMGEGEISFSVSSDTYAHGVYFDLHEDLLLSDEYFDLLPGEVRKISVKGYRLPQKTSDIIPRCI